MLDVYFLYRANWRRVIWSSEHLSVLHANESQVVPEHVSPIQDADPVIVLTAVLDLDISMIVVA